MSDTTKTLAVTAVAARLSLLLVLCSARGADAQTSGVAPCPLHATMTNSNPTYNDAFGQCAALDGDTLLVSAPGAGFNGPDSGCIYAYVREGQEWVETQRIVAPPEIWSQYFGQIMDMKGQWAVTTSSAGTSHAGIVYVYRKFENAWQYFQKLTCPDYPVQKMFGVSMKLDGDRLIVGAYYGNSGIYLGSAYVFHFDGFKWALESRLVQPDSEQIYNMSRSVALSGDVAFVSAIRYHGNYVYSGRVYVYRFLDGIWKYSQTLQIGSGTVTSSNENFAINMVVADGELCTAITKGGNFEAGLIRMHRPNALGQWSQTQSLQPPANNTSNGINLAMRGSMLLVGSRGNVYAYQRDAAGAWIHRNELQGIFTNSPYMSVTSVGIEGSMAIVTTNAGYSQVSTFEGVPFQDCNRNNLPDGCDIEDGISRDLNLNGRPDDCDCETAAFTGPLLQAADASTNDYFGTSVAVSNGTMIVGAPYADSGQYFPIGAAYILKFNGTNWVQQARLNSFWRFQSQFASKVAISEAGDLAVVGAPEASSKSSYAGTAFVYLKVGTTWQQIASLMPNDPIPQQAFGSSVAISGNIIAIGCMRDDDFGTGSGSISLYEFNGRSCQYIGKLYSPTPAVQTYFGRNIIATSTRMAVADGQNHGSVRIFVRNGSTFVHEQTLIYPGTTVRDLFGSALSLSDDLLTVGAPNRYSRGAAYVYRRSGSTWTQEAMLVPAGLIDNAQFGRALAIRGSQIAVGAAALNVANWSGAVYLYERDATEWRIIRTFGSSEPSEYLGAALAIDGSTLVVGASAHDLPIGENAGAVRLMNLGEDCNSNLLSDLCDVAGQASLDLNGNMVPDECENPACPADVMPIGGDQVVNIDDLVAVVTHWGSCLGCSADVVPPHGNGMVNIDDLVAVITQWGECPD